MRKEDILVLPTGFTDFANEVGGVGLRAIALEPLGAELPPPPIASPLRIARASYSVPL